MEEAPVGSLPRAASHLGDLHCKMTPTEDGKIGPERETLGSVDTRLESNSWQLPLIYTGLGWS
jgi:hypothetical protein